MIFQSLAYFQQTCREGDIVGYLCLVNVCIWRGVEWKEWIDKKDRTGDILGLRPPSLSLFISIQLLLLRGCWGWFLMF